MELAVLPAGRSLVSSVACLPIRPGLCALIGRCVLKLLLFITEDWYFWSHRLALARAAKRSGFEVVLVTRVSRYAARIEAEGFKLIPLAIERRSGNPLKELRVLAHLTRIYRTERPDIAHHVALKPILYGSLAAKFAGVPAVVNALAGLGYVFSSERFMARMLRPMVKCAYRLLLNRGNVRTIVQNPDDLRLLTRLGVLDSEMAVLIRGSGVDLDLFRPSPEPAGTPVVVLAARMLSDKGVREFVGAARLLRRKGVNARFVLAGDRDTENPTAIPLGELADWQTEGIVEWHGHRSDIHELISHAHIVCLPSYREGTPKVLLEAAACGRAIVATDVPGCREVVRDGENGLTVPPRNAESLAMAIGRLIEDPGLRHRMGGRGRQIAEAEFSLERVVEQTLAVYKKLLAK